MNLVLLNRFSKFDVAGRESVEAPTALLPAIMRKFNVGLRSLFMVMAAVLSFYAATPAFANLPEPVPLPAGSDGWESGGAGSARYATPQEACLRQFLRYVPHADFKPPYELTPIRWQCDWEGTTVNPGDTDWRCGGGRIYAAPGQCRTEPGGALSLADKLDDVECSCDAAERKVASSPSPSTGHPVSIATGTKTWAEEDYSSEDGLLKVERKYRSRMRGGIRFSFKEPDRFGSNWQGMIPGPLVFRASNNSEVEYLPESGSLYGFVSTTDQSNKTFNPNIAKGSDHRLSLEIIAPIPAGTGRKAFIETAPVSAAGVGEFRVEMPNGDYTLYRRPTNAPSDIGGSRVAVAVEHVKASGYKQYFDYTGSSPVPYRLRDSFGREIGFEWQTTSDFPGRFGTSERAIKKLTLPDGTYLEYDYDDGVGRLNPNGQASFGGSGAIIWSPGSSAVPKTRLKTVRRKSASGAILWSRKYLYENASYRFALTGIEDGEGRRLTTYTYDFLGEVVSTESAGGADRHEFTRSYPGTSRMIRTVKNSLGHEKNYEFQTPTSTQLYSASRLLSVRGAANGSVEADQMTYSYSGDLVTSRTDRRGTVTGLTNDAAFGRPTLVRDASGSVAEQQTGITWHPKWDLPVVQQEDGLRVDNSYDAQGRLTSTAATDTTTHSQPYATSGQSRSTAFGWTATGKISQINGPLAPDAQGRDDITGFAYDAVGNLTSVTDPLGHITTYAGHDANGRAATMTDPNGVVTAMAYDLLGRLTSVNIKHPTNPALDAITNFEYDGEGRVTGITRPQTAKLTVDYSSIGRVTALRSSDGERIEFTYDPMGNVVSQKVRRSDGSVTASITQSFDALGRLLKTTLGNGRPRSFAYDKEGNVTAVTDPRNFTSNHAFDALGRLATTTSPDGGVEATSYNTRDETVSFKDGIDITTQFVRNGFGEMIQETSPDRGTSTYYYDAAGRMTAAIDGRGQRIDYAYDIAGRLLTKTPVGRPVSEIITYSYDTGGIGPYQTGRLTRVTDATGATVFSYDHRGNLIRRQQKIGSGTAANLTYSYDLADRISVIGYPSGRQVHYLYDAKGRVTSINTRASTAAAWVSLASNISYQPFGAVEGMTLGNGLAVANDRGIDGRLRSRRLTNVSSAAMAVGTKLSDLTYLYDPDGNVTNIDDGVTPARSAAYGYDAAGRLNLMIGEGAATAAAYSYTSGTNKLASVTTPAGTRSIAYDPRGNPAAETRPAGQAVTLAYDGYGRLTSYARQGEASLAHAYNGLDDRVATTTTPAGGAADTRRFIYAPDGRVLGEYGAGATDVRAEFIWMSPEVGAQDDSLFGGDDGLGGYMPLAVATPGGGLGWVHGNHMGVPHVFTDATGAQVAVPASYTLPGFPGQSQTFADLYYNRHRDYDSSTGRYIQADPIGLAGGASPYSYAMNSPLRYTDPTGEIVPIAAGFLFGAGLEYFTNDCASASDILFAGAIGGIGGGLGGAALLRHGARSLTRNTGKEWSHGIGRQWVNKIPSKRARKFLNQRGGYNGSWVSPKRHYKHDYYRYPKGNGAWGEKWHPAFRFLDRIPDWMKASVASGAGGAGIAGDCKCQ